MKKIILCAVIGLTAASSAQAGFLDMLGITKKKEPATLAEACDTAEIKKICPEILLGDMTLSDCLMKNVKELSTQCATFVKKSATEKIGAISGAVTDQATGAANTAAADKAAAAEKVAAAKESAQKTGDSLRAAKESAVQAASAFKGLLK